MKETIIQLQEALTHQEADIAKMSEELYTQQKEITVLRHQVARLEAKLTSMAEELPIRSIDQETPPPHY